MSFPIKSVKSSEVNISWFSWSPKFNFTIYSHYSAQSKWEKTNSFPRKSARNCPTRKAVRSQKSVKPEKPVYVEKTDNSSKIFKLTSLSFFFFTMPHNDRGYGHLADSGSVRCRGTTKWMREQNLLIARQPANANRRVLPNRALVVKNLSSVLEWM